MERESHHSQEVLDEPVLVASLRFWRAESVSHDVDEISLLFDTARRSLPDIPEPNDDVPPRPTGARTVVEMAVPVAEGDSEDALSDAFDVGLACLRDFQRAYYLVGGRHPIALASREGMPPGVPLGIRQVTEDQDIWPDGLSLYVLNMNVHADARLPDLTDDQLEVMPLAVRGMQERRVFMTYLEFAREARVAFERDGNYRAAIVFTATAAEVLLDDLLSHLLWEEGLRPEDGAVIFDEAPFLANRVRTQYHPRLGGDWSSPKSPIEEWKTSTALVRHRVVHGGYEPDIEAVQRAMHAAAGLEDFLVRRVSPKRSVARFPRTAFKLLGEPGLRRRNRWTRRVEQLTTDPNEPHWDSTFARWNETMSRCRREGMDLAPPPSAAQAVVVLVVRPDGRHYWCLHDRTARMAGPIPAPPEGVPQPYQSGVEHAFQRAREDPSLGALSLALMDCTLWAEPVEWRHEYRVVPEAGVMLNRDDLDHDLGGSVPGHIEPADPGDAAHHRTGFRVDPLISRRRRVRLGLWRRRK